MEMDKEFLEYVVKALVENPNDVKIDRTVDEMGVLITLTVNSADMGKIIGRQGNTAKAIRTLLRVIGMKNNARVNLKINEPNGGTGSASKYQEEEIIGGQSHYDMKDVDAVMNDLKGI
jgi:predicted RNA-binding protein YlqC (UPF0109 family)